MKRVSRKFMSLALCLFLLAGMLPLSAAAKSTGAPFARRMTLNLWDGANVTYFLADGTQKTVTMPASITDSAEGWSWNADTKTLTLSGANILGTDVDTADYSACGLRLPENATLFLREDTHSSIASGSSSKSDCYGLYAPRDLTITGTGSLSVTGGTAARGDSYGIQSDGWDYNNRQEYGSCFTLESGTVTATGGSARGSSQGLSTYCNSVNVKGGALTVIGGTTAVGSSYGADITYGHFIMEDGELSCLGGMAEDDSSCGLSLSSDEKYACEIRGGIVWAAGGTGKGRNSIGIERLGFANQPNPDGPDVLLSLTISGGLVVASSDRGNPVSGGKKRAIHHAAPTLSNGVADLLDPGAGKSWEQPFAVYGDGNIYKVKTDDALDFTTAPPNAGDLDADGYAWDADASTLTLKNLILVPSAAPALTLPDQAILKLEGVNLIRGEDTDTQNTDSTAVSCEALNIQENQNGAGGALYALGGKASGVNSTSEGISSSDAVTVESGTVWAVGGPATNRSCGMVTVSLTLQEGGMTAVGGISDQLSWGVRLIEELRVEGGTLTALGGPAESSDGINVTGSVTVTDGLLCAIGGPADGSNGINRLNSGGRQLSVQGGVLAAAGGPADSRSAGIAEGGTVLASGGVLTAQGGAATESYGIASTNMPIQVQGGALYVLAGPGSDDNIGIRVSGLTVESGTVTVGGTARALNGTLEAPGSALEVLAGTEADGSGLGEYREEQLADYKYLRIQAVAPPPPPPAVSRHTLTATAGEGGSIEPSGTVAVASGGSQEFTFAPQENWWLAGLDIDGTVQKAAGNSYTFADVTEDHTIRALFLPFTDMNAESWYAPDAAALYDRDVMRGVSGTEFGPNQTTSRGMVAAMLWRMAGSPEPKQNAGFTDVKPGAYYEKAVDWAAETGIASGYGDQKFGPNDAMTREQLAAVLYRYAEYQGMDVSARNDLSKFTDVGKISAYAKEPMAWANAVGLVQGRTETELAPKGTATRAETAALLNRFLGLK